MNSIFILLFLKNERRREKLTDVNRLWYPQCQNRAEIHCNDILSSSVVLKFVSKILTSVSKFISELLISISKFILKLLIFVLKFISKILIFVSKSISKILIFDLKFISKILKPMKT